MVGIHNLVQVSEYEWEIPMSFRPDMRVPVKIFATRELLEQIAGDNSLEQVVNATTLPGLVGKVVVMPDMHQGYGFPIGGVAATIYPKGVISPGAIGYDINCGVRLLASVLELKAAASRLDELATRINQNCPSGVGKEGAIRLTIPEMEKVLREGARWALKNGYATQSDLDRTEESGCMEGAVPSKVSERAKARGRTQIGSVGSGNHFIEVDVVEEIFDAAACSVFGLHEGCLVVQIHCGSRGLGHQVCTDYVQEFQVATRRYGINLPDRELVCAPMDSPEGESYLSAMRAAANFAFANRQVLSHSIRRAFEETFTSYGGNWHLSQVYDVCHNIGKLETHPVDGQQTKVCVHRKGATRAFGPGMPGLPREYLPVGQPVLVPGSMGTSSWVLIGMEPSMQQSFGSCCHGAGRTMSRAKARHQIRGEELRRTLSAQGIQLRSGSLSGLAEEAPAAYKDVDAVVETVTSVGIARKAARLRPLVVIKG